ncbi:helix-turn-helix domain-containing protein [Kitasatospora sp. NPDC001539]|uniref:helix-turn-helix domain-containing protein n=1 Tax=unclassified Kitasatospora TaxID=2633591 RepID=UPI003329E383
MNTERVSQRRSPVEREELRRQAIELEDSGHTVSQIAWNLRISPSTARRLLTTATRDPHAPDPDRPTWFTGPDEQLALLRRAAQARGVVLDLAVAPGEEDAQELTDELADILLAEGGFTADWEITKFGDMVERLIDALNQYAQPD